MKTNFILTFELSRDMKTLNVHLDKNGIISLQNILDDLKNNSKTDHVHLMSHSYGGEELSEEKQSESSILLNNVKIHYWE